MARAKTLCEQHDEGESAFHNGLDAGRYHAAVAIDTLPQELRRDDHVIRRGYAVGFGQWFFFDDVEPAVAFGRAARMSLDCSGYGLYPAAHELRFCDRHQTDERVLLVYMRGTGQVDEEIEILKRFVQGVKEHPWSSHWLGINGYITDFNNGYPVKTARRSLPL
jgi:hypothetical protein